MSATNDRPVIFPLSNPLTRSEATPTDIDCWSEGRAIIGTGQFPPITRNGRPFTVDQTNNSYIFPGVALGIIAVKARRVNDRMFMAAARALADMSPALADPKANLLMPVGKLREVAITVARRVAIQAHDDGLVDEPLTDADIEARIDGKVWQPVYHDLCTS